jgi:hypothetical protein
MSRAKLKGKNDTGCKKHVGVRFELISFYCLFLRASNDFKEVSLVDVGR